MSSKKKNLDDELSDVSSEEENIVNFAKKKGDKIKEKPKEKILSKKTKREQKESESDSDSSEIKKNKKFKKEKKEKKPAHDSDDDEIDEEIEEKKEDKKTNKNKKKKEEQSESESDKKEKIDNNDDDDDDSSEDENMEQKGKKVDNKQENKKKKIPNGKESSDDEEKSSSSEIEKIKPKQKNNNQKKKSNEKEKEKSDSDSESEEKSEKEEKREQEEEQKEDNEPKLVKNPNKVKEEESEEEENGQKKTKSYNSGTWPELFVNNLSYKTTDESLKKYFSKYGEVESTKIVYDKETGRPKGVGFCKFCDSSSAAKALADNDKLFLDGRPIAVSYSNDKKGSAKVRKSKFQGNKNYEGEKFSIFIGNLSFKTNEDGIKNLFEDCGNIIDIRIAKRPDGNPRGFAHVDFDSKEGMENALEKTGYRLDGRELRIDKTTNQPSANKKTFGENSYYKNKKKNNNENDEDDLNKAKKTGKIINTGSKSQKIENSDDDSDDDE
jgi:nucleolin